MTHSKLLVELFNELSIVIYTTEPKTRFAVHSEVGSDLFKFKNIPKISDFIIKKLKGIIVKRLVHPNSHK